MLEIKVAVGSEEWDPQEECFIMPKEQTLVLEHSLVSLSKWESKWCRPFLSKAGMNTEETLDYIRCMTVNKNVPPETYNYITNAHIEQIREYIDAPMTATWFNEEKNKSTNKEQITSELIYYWMIALNMKVDYFDKWHLNRLLTLIRVCNIKNAPPKKMSKRDVMSRNAALNASRRKTLNSKG